VWIIINTYTHTYIVWTERIVTSEILTVAMQKIKVLWDGTLCHLLHGFQFSEELWCLQNEQFSTLNLQYICCTLGLRGLMITENAYFKVIHGERLQTVTTLAQWSNIVYPTIWDIQTLKLWEILSNNLKSMPVEFRTADIQALQTAQFRQCYHNTEPVHICPASAIHSIKCNYQNN